MIEDFTLMHLRWKPLGEQAREGGDRGICGSGTGLSGQGERGQGCECMGRLHGASGARGANGASGASGASAASGASGSSGGSGASGAGGAIGASGASSKCDATPLEDLFICSCSAIQSCRKTREDRKHLQVHVQACSHVGNTAIMLVVLHGTLGVSQSYWQWNVKMTQKRAYHLTIASWDRVIPRYAEKASFQV